uniref:SGNH domain-containing protein n=1 Tax=Acrobeloides nanus TaxID=290746 RepID=A0A914CH14_9BILA
MAKRSRTKIGLNDMKKLEKKHQEDQKFLRQRLALIKCEKCVWFNWNKIICNDGICKPYDEELELPLYRNKDHINRLGVAKIYPHTKEVIDNALKKIH